jgi:serine/threonine protein kinase/tetratricopeptide (TPR) repeat protein
VTGPVPAKIHPRWQRLNELFFHAARLQGAERQAFLARETLGEPELEREVLALLERGDERKFGPPTRTLGGGLALAPRDERLLVGRVIAKYQLVSVLGRGGAGTVFLGERADRQFSGKVAVKVVDRSAAADLGMRFRAERQILASLNHPNIARLIDAGETDDGQPYLVMEYVEGQPLDQYCDERKLDLRKRLQLFIDICAAVQYAHQNLIIHRDLKPANILVTADGTAKLLDFGIAKLLNHGNGSNTVSELTRMNERLLTPEYASPEQIIGGAITTASDVYSLGIVLYRLLTGLRPYDLSGAASQLEMERSICVADPPRPSANVQRAMQSGAAEGEQPIAALALARSVSPERLRRRLVGDVDAIVMRALRKEPQHRYSSVERLVADIRHHLDNEPVQARQGNWVYYTQRFVRRHTTAVIASAGFLMFLTAVAVVMSIQRQSIAAALERATHDRERAEQVSDFMLDVFSAADPFINAGKEPTARALLDQAARNIQGDLGQQPEVRARLLEAIGRSYRRLGQPERAVAYLQDSLRIQRQLLQKDDAGLGSIVTEIAIALRYQDRMEESDGYFTEALQISRQTKDLHSEEYAKLLVDLGRLEKFRSNPKQALQHLEQALQLMRVIKGPKDPEVGAILAEMSNIKVWLDDLEGAEIAARAAVETYQTMPADYPDRVMAEYYLADLFLNRGRIEDAASLFERVLAAQRRLYGVNSRATAETLASLAQVRIAQKNFGTAEKLIIEALDSHRESASTAHLQIGYLQTMLGTVQMRLNRFGDAERTLRATLVLYGKNIRGDHQYIASAEHYLGEALLAQSKYREAESVLLEAIEHWKRTGAPVWRSARSRSALGEALQGLGRTDEAEQYLVDSYRDLNADAVADSDSKRIARERVTKFYTALGKREKLNTLLQTGGGNSAPARQSSTKPGTSASGG